MPAPIVLFVYARLFHTRATIEALARNTLAPGSDLIIFSDGAKNETAEAAVAEVRALIAAVKGFKSVRVVQRERNLGLARSIISGVTEIINAHGEVIVLEDDLVTARGFLQYMNDALVHYRDDPKAFSIGGYQFPAKTMTIPQRYGFDTYAGYRCCSWGWATWRDRWARIDWNMSYFDAFYADPQQRALFDRGGPDMSEMLRHQKEGRIDSWAIRFCHAHFADDMRCIYPVKSQVMNIGLDNTGVHCGVDPRREHEFLDDDWRAHKFCRASDVDPAINKGFYVAFAPEPPSLALVRERGLYGTARSVAGRAYRRTRRIAGAVYRRVHPPVYPADVLVVNSFQKNGGAARAAYRAYQGIRQAFPQSYLLTLINEERAPGVFGRYQMSLTGLLTAKLTNLDRLPLRRYPNRSDATFTPALWRNPLRISLKRFKPRLVHLHWIAASMLRVEDIERIKVPVVWTLHDAWAFTGGCHYPADCTGFHYQCGNCPQLRSGRDNDLSRDAWLRKKRAFGRASITVVTPTRWLANLAGDSTLFAGRHIEVIPNGLDTGVFRPIDKRAAKAYFDLDAERPVFAFGAQWITDPRKGGDLLRAALESIELPCTLLTFGRGTFALSAQSSVTIRNLGPLHDDISLAMMYSAADAFICPSREDNLPNTVAEAMACGTPCIAFGINGLPEMITHKANGWLAEPFNPRDIASGIAWIAHHQQPAALRSAAREKAVAEYSLDVMTTRYRDLFARILG